MSDSVAMCTMLCGTVLLLFLIGNANDLVKAWQRLKKGDDE